MDQGSCQAYSLLDYRRCVTPLAVIRRHRQGIALWVIAVLFACGCVLLGRWQLHRYQAKHERAQQISRSNAAPEVPLRQLLASTSTPLPEHALYRAVTASGTYLTDQTLLVRNRPHTGDDADPTFGYEVVVPLVTADGDILLVDRGWIPNGRSGRRPDAVPTAPSGPVQVVVRLRRGEPERGRDLPAGQIGSINLPTIRRILDRPMFQTYGALIEETPRPAEAPALLDPVVADGGEGINASYAVQWVVFAAMGLAFPVWLARRRRESADEQGELGTAEVGQAAPDSGTPDAPEPVGSAVSGPAGRRGASRRRAPKHHIWDDEDE
jgi:cytochrome oxidase assembly protein ShyY1